MKIKKKKEKIGEICHEEKVFSCFAGGEYAGRDRVDCAGESHGAGRGK